MKSALKFILPVLFIVSGCMGWDEGWKTKFQAAGTGDVKALLASAAAMEPSIDSADKVLNIIAAYEKIAAIDPANYTALWKAGEYNMLYAYIYTKDKDTKYKHYIKSLQFTERAMYTNPKFKELADSGKPAWECVNALSKNEMDAMFYWYVAAGQMWTECYGSVGHLVNFYWPARAKKVLERMTAIDPDWGSGKVHMAWGSSCAITPGFLGGDDRRSAEEFEKAIKVGPNLLVNYYCRAKYLHVKNKDKAAFKKDLEHVISKDIKTITYDIPWAIGYQMKAKELLAETGKLFK